MCYNIYGDVEQDFATSYKTYRYGNNRIEDDIRNTDTYSFSYAYRDKRFEKEQLMKYATLEYEKSENERNVTADIEKGRCTGTGNSHCPWRRHLCIQSAESGSGAGDLYR